MTEELKAAIEKVVEARDGHGKTWDDSLAATIDNLRLVAEREPLPNHT